MAEHYTIALLIAAALPLSVAAQHTSPANRTPLQLEQLVDSIHGGSVDVVTGDRLNQGLVTNSLDVLNGKAAGVTMSVSGADRMAMLNSVRVRGTTSLTGGNDPLVIIDGVYADLTTLSSIYPGDIESFTILKNAAETAPYGARGASGVIQVTTKHGHGGRFQISYDGTVGIEGVYKNLEMLDRNGYLSTAKALGEDVVDGGYDNNFVDLITRTGTVHNHHVAFSGGGDNSGYRASLSVMDHDMVVKNYSRTNFIAKVDLNQRAFDDALNIDLGVFGSSLRNSSFFDYQKIFYSAATMNPTLSFDRQGTGGWQRNQNASQIGNPGAYLNEKNHDKNLGFNSHIKFDFDLMKVLGLHKDNHQTFDLSIFGSYSYASTENDKFMPTWVWAKGEARRAETKTEDWLVNGTLTYSQQWGIHRLKLMGLSEYQQNNLRGFNTAARGFTSNSYGYDNLAAGTQLYWGDQGAQYSEERMLSFLAQAEYTLLDRYTLNANIRADGSTLFGENHRWGWFPSVSFNWDVMKEPFMRHQKVFSLLKLRTGYGLSGNTGGISAYNALTLLGPVGIVPWQGASTTVTGLQKNINPDLKWETRGNFNIGIDAGFLDNRLLLTAEYYYSKTWDMLYMYDVPVPPFTYNKLLANIGEMSNEGLELGIGVTPIRKKDMELDINMNMSFQRNRVLSLSGNYNGTALSANAYTALGGLNGAGQHGGYNNVVYQIVGQPLGVFYLPHCEGLTTDASGNTMYNIVDLNNDGKVDLSDGGDRYIAGQATPKMTLGSNISFRYKDWDISLQMNGAFGHKIFNGTYLSYMCMTTFPDYNVLKEAPAKNIKDQRVSDYWLEKGDYLNFDYLTIGWNVPLKHNSDGTPRNKIISALRLALSVNNLATITSYSGLTPMINSYIANDTFGIDDKRCYPVYRSYSLSVSIQF
ncbi:MAG: SusC/RagA family TonB-linked outer membrane protein [Prevotellaceae bacterium]|nr:SusC/RagA family TonB-linked outer membrane protein [Prevotellaceae bacterium]